MAVSYKKLWYLLVDKKMSKAALERKAGLTHYSMNKMGRDEDVSTDVLSKICDALDCSIEDIVEFKPSLNDSLKEE
ncbi:MAG: helix-turn-helix transcriptional regulator [Oscillospiraceae bacterium]|nr:helix-turn-helix transcriptional regulator [Oscillospiraceae bacterium]